MPSRRRSRNKNIGNNLAEVTRRLRTLERKPVRTKLTNRVVKTAFIAPNAVTADEVSFGTTIITDKADTNDAYVENPKDNLIIFSSTSKQASVYSADDDTNYPITDPAAQSAADTAQETADTAQETADGKAKTYTQNDEPTGEAFNVGDLWIDTNDGNRLYRYNGSAWVSAQDTAISTAQSTANGKNKVYYDTVAPGSTANTAGDIWWQYASGVVIGQFVGAGGTSWTSAPIGNAVIANIDAGKITTGFLDVAGTVKITTDKTKTGTQARIEITSDGFFAYNGSLATVSITNSGTALFTGSITGSTITGGTIRTSATGTRIEITSANNIYFYDNISTSFGVISVTGYSMYLYGPGSDLGLGAKMQLYSDQHTTNSLAGLAAIQSGGSGDITLTTVTNLLRIDGATTAVTLAAATPVDTFGLRNIRGRLTADFNPATNTSGTDGDIVVVYS